MDSNYSMTGRKNEALKLERKDVKFDKKKSLTIVLIIAVSVTAMTIWRVIQVRKVTDRYEVKKTELLQKSSFDIIENSKYFLKLIAKSYAWAVSAEMRNGNMQRVQQYGYEIISRKGFISAMIVNRNGKIVSSTDKNFLNLDFVSVSHPFYLTVDSTVVNMINDTIWIIASPVMEDKRRVGTVIINYNLQRAGMKINGARQVEFQ